MPTVAGCVRVVLSLVAGSLLVSPAPAFAAGPPVALEILRAEYRDLDGDRDPFPDTGETGRLRLTLRNDGAPLADLVLVLTSSDRDVVCIGAGRVAAASFPSGSTLTIGSLDPGEEGFTFTAGEALVSTATQPARVSLCLHVAAAGIAGSIGPLCFFLPADADLPAGAAVVPVAGPDGLPGTADDGTLVETFDVDRDGIGGVDLSDGRAGAPNDTLGVTVGTAPGAADMLGAVACGGFAVPPGARCFIDPDDEMSWHVHCPAGACGPPAAAGVKPALAVTPAGGEMAFSGRNSLHWGIHREAGSRNGDTVAERSIAAFMTRPVNLTPAPRPGELDLAFMQIADMLDDNERGLALPPGQATVYGDVQIRSDRDPDPGRDDWGLWDKLVPYANVYDHTPYVWSLYGQSGFYCTFTPDDAGTAPPAPRGVHETMCRPQGVWSHCGSAWGDTTTRQCPGPGQPGATAPSSGALWVQTRLSLEPYAGQRVQVRWIAQGWEFDPCADAFCDPDGSWDIGTLEDDGWWLDDISLSGAIQSQAGLVPDGRASAGGRCPDPGCGGEDADRDGVPDVCDDCPAAFDPAQGDADADGQGDLCDRDDGPIYVLARQPSRLLWQPEARIERFQIYRGAVSGLVDADANGAADRFPVCSVAAEVPSTQIDDATLPARGAAFYYIVVGMGPARDSAPGRSSNGVRRVLESSGACP